MGLVKCLKRSVRNINKIQYKNSHCYELSMYDEDKIKELLMYHKIIKVENDTLYLDNRIELEIMPNEGCGCGAGWYEITELNGCDNVITNVELNCENGKWDSNWLTYDKMYNIFVYAENKKIKVLQVDGNDGNGCYGTVYEIKVKIPRQKGD